MSLSSLPRRFLCQRCVSFLLDVPNLPFLVIFPFSLERGTNTGCLSSSQLVQLSVLPTSLLAGASVVCSVDVFVMCLFPSCS